MVIRKEDGKWIVDGSIRGRRQRIRFDTKAEAEQFKSALKMQDVTGMRLHTVAADIGLKYAIRKYVDLVSVRKAKVTEENERRFFDALFDYFGDISLAEISALQLEEFRSALRKRVSDASVNRMFNLYRHFFRQCQDWELIETNPTARLRQYLVDAPDKKVWTDAEIERVLTAAAPWARDAFYFLALTAGRAGEMSRLKWTDVILETDQPHVVLRSQKGNGRWRERNIPIVGELREFLRERRVEATKQFRARPQDFVFRNASGDPMTANQLSREMCRLTGKLKLSGLSLHGLRHTFLTRMVEGDLSLEKVRQISGHTNLKTLQQYLHVDSANLRDAMEKAVSGRVIRINSVRHGHKTDTSTG